MNKPLVAAAVMALACSAALAQSGVAVYGIVDVGLSRESGGTASVSKLTGGVAAGSRLGFKGTEDLGGGGFAQFVLEAGINADTGASGQGGVLFGRQAFVGIGSKRLGTVTLGRQYSPQYLTTVLADPFASGTAGDSKNLIQAAGSVGRLDNSIKYASPAWGPFTMELAYAAGEMPGAGSAGRHAGVALAYTAGPLAVRWAYHNKDNDTATARAGSARNMLLAATYAFRPARLHLAYGINKGPFSSPLRNPANPFGVTPAPTAASLSRDSKDALVGLTVPFGVHMLLASAIHKDDRMAANQDATQYALGYRYLLSKRTDIYTVYSKIINRKGATYTVGNATEAGAGDRAWNLGLRHTF
ncbi:porin [Massilia niastensis]|uniref:porin n=1 Tax=Massilia niastensis TaxID=544911 RepID=UPI0003A15CD3|nr:porin [Massilia niastensis]